MANAELPLEPDEQQLATLHAAVTAFVERRVADRGSVPASSPPAEPELLRRLLTGPVAHGRPIDEVLGDLSAALDTGIEPSSPGFLSYIPTGGLHTSALGSFLGAVTNQYTGGSHASPGSVALEESVIRWMTSLFGLPPTAGGILLSGGSIANLTAVVTARARFGDDFRDGVVYASEVAHHSVHKAAMIAGIAADRVRSVSTTAQLALDIDALQHAIAADRAAGLAPMMVVSNAGATDTGTIDPIAACAEIAQAEGMWHHVDGAYGGFFQLTDRGRQRLDGISQADSITVDAHKSLFLPFGVGGLLVRDRATLVEAHEGTGAYMQDITAEELPHYFAMGPELTRPNRGLAVWLPLQLHGVDRFRTALDDMLDLAAWAAQQIDAMPALELVCESDLSIVTFRSTLGDDESRRILDAMNATREVHLSSTTIAGRFTLRLAFLSHRTDMAVARRVLDLLGQVATPA